MVVGSPIHYYYNSYYPRDVPTLGSSPQFSYFHQFERYYPSSMDGSEELMYPPSPNSIQSDSDNSVSSVEVSPKQIQVKKSITKTPEKTEVKCCWSNCGIVFPTLDQLATHVSKVHAAGGPGGLFFCGWEGCTRNNKGFNARYKMLVHVRTHTNEKPHKCNLCEKSFSRAENLKIHSRSHSGEKPYVCPVPGCNKAYSNSSDRFKHTRTHEVEKPYQCKVPGCPKRYTDPSSLRKHVKTYKHFIHEVTDLQANKTTEKSSQTDDHKTEKRFVPQCQDNSPSRHPTDFISIDTILNLKKEEKSFTWNHMLNSEYTYPSYTSSFEEKMDLDVPLDLSLHKKHI